MNSAVETSWILARLLGTELAVGRCLLPVACCLLPAAAAVEKRDQDTSGHIRTRGAGSAEAELREGEAFCLAGSLARLHARAYARAKVEKREGQKERHRRTASNATDFRRLSNVTALTPNTTPRRRRRTA